MKETPKTITAFLITLLIFCASVYVVYTLAPVDEYYAHGYPKIGVDFRMAFRDAALRLLQGENPYSNEFFFNPPWILVFLIPLSLSSPELGTAILFVLSIFLYIFIAMKLKMNPLLIIVFLIFSPLWINLANGNIDALVALGFILPPQLGLFLVLVKPQLGIAVALFWLVQAWRAGGLREVMRVFLPVTIAYILSFIFYGFYFSGAADLVHAKWNASIFPSGIPIGLLLIVLSLIKKDIRFAIAASPFLVTYLTPHGWAFTWLGLLSWISREIPSFKKIKLVYFVEEDLYVIESVVEYRDLIYQALTRIPKPVSDLIGKMVDKRLARQLRYLKEKYHG